VAWPASTSAESDSEGLHMVNLYLLIGAVEAGFVNTWIIAYAVMLLLWGHR
jgi:hypothetical protein